VYWRNRTTSPKGKAFDSLLDYFGVHPSELTGQHILDSGKGECPICQNTFLINDEEWGVLYCLHYILDWQIEVRARYKEYRSPVADASLDDIKYPKDLGADTIYQLKEMVKHTENFIKRPEKWMIMAGSYGLGKTHMLRAINTAFDPIALYIAARDIEAITHMTRKDDTLGDFVENLTYAPILLLDDLGEEYGGRLVKTVVDRVINARYERFPDYPVLVATNMPPKELQGYLPRSADRLFDKARSVQLSINSKTSFRKIHPEMRA
jgi:DNA replication protein DnaC